MSLVINHNMMAANVARNLNSHYANLAKSTQRLSTGMRINTAADDAAGLAIRELQRADIAALQQGARNANDAISLIQVADGALSIIDEKLIRMKELAEQAATGSYDSTQRLMIESEYQAMASEITRIANATDFNGVHLLDGTLSGAHNGSGLTATGKMKVHFGTGNDSAEDYYYIEIGCATAAALGLGNAAYITSQQELTTEYFEKLRDEAAQAAYDLTYKKKYAEFYQTVYTRLVTGTSETAALDANTASTQADAIARAQAEKLAQVDKEMSAAMFDKIYNDNYMSPYLTAYQKYLDAGKTESQAKSLADADAASTAMQAAIAAAKQALTDGASHLQSLNALPPTNSVGAEALMDEGWTLAYNSAYKTIYDGLYEQAVTDALAQTSIAGIDDTSATLTPLSGTVLTNEQVLAIHQAVDAAASEQATTLADKARASLADIYNTAYGSSSGGAYKTYYDYAVGTLGYPEDVAENYAREKASADGWNAVKTALTSGSAFASANVTDLADADFNVSTTVEVPTTLPTTSQFNDLKSTIQSQLKSYVYKNAYNKAYTGLLAKAEGNPSIIPNPGEATTAQIAVIHTAADAAATSIADEVSEQVANALERVYNDAYDATSNTSEGYLYYYNQAIEDGKSTTAANTYALDMAGRLDAWNAVKSAIAAANVSTTPFGINPPMADTTPDVGHYLDTTQFDIAPITITIPDATGADFSITYSGYTGLSTDVDNAYKKVGADGIDFLNTRASTTQGNIPVTSTWTAPSGTADNFYATIGTNASLWLDNLYAMNGGENAILDSCAKFFDQYEIDSTPTLQAGGTISTQQAAQEAISAINNAIVSKDKIRAHLGALQNRLENTITNLNLQAENLQAAESRISDVDVATEMTEFTRQQILAQSAVAMLAQANSLPQMAMQLIGG